MRSDTGKVRTAADIALHTRIDQRRYDNIMCTNELTRIACIPLDFIDGRSGAVAAQGEPKTRT